MYSTRRSFPSTTSIPIIVSPGKLTFHGKRSLSAIYGSEYMPDISGKISTSVTPLQLIGPILDSDGIYTFDIELRTIDDPNKWIYSLSGFHYEINFEKSK